MRIKSICEIRNISPTVGVEFRVYPSEIGPKSNTFTVFLNSDEAYSQVKELRKDIDNNPIVTVAVGDIEVVLGSFERIEDEVSVYGQLTDPKIKLKDGKNFKVFTISVPSKTGHLSDKERLLLDEFAEDGSALNIHLSRTVKDLELKTETEKPKDETIEMDLDAQKEVETEAEKDLAKNNETEE